MKSKLFKRLSASELERLMKENRRDNMLNRLWDFFDILFERFVKLAIIVICILDLIYLFKILI